MFVLALRHNIQGVVDYERHCIDIQAKHRHPIIKRETVIRLLNYLKIGKYAGFFLNPVVLASIAICNLYER